MDRRRRSPEAWGFTLVELIVTSALIGIVAATVVATFTGGLQVWERVQAQGQQERWIELAFAQIRQDVRAARRFKPVSFDGDYDSFSFPAMVSWQPRAEAAREEIGRRGYYFDSARKILCRSEHPYRLIRAKRLREMCRPVLTDVDRVRFSYYVLGEQGARYSWASSCSQEEPPLAVKMELGYHDDATRRPTTHELVIRIPIAAAR